MRDDVTRFRLHEGGISTPWFHIGEQGENVAMVRTPVPFSLAEVQSTFGFTLTNVSRGLVETFFHYCLECDTDVEACTCHDDGKGDQ